VDKDPSWYLDYGVSHHITSDVNIFSTYNKGTNLTIIKFARGYVHVVLRKVIMTLSHSTCLQQIPNVFHVLKVTKNLLFVKTIIDKGYHVVFNPNNCWVMTIQKIEEGGGCWQMTQY
jgi:hypothetical protein